MIKGQLLRSICLMSKFNEISIIDDDKIQVFIFHKFIGKMDLTDQVSSFTNGKEAFDAMKKRSENSLAYPEIIFLDLNMPVWDGWQFFEEFQKLPNADKVTIYILTSSLSSEDYQRASSLGLKDYYLNKPLKYEELEDLLKHEQRLSPITDK